MDATLREPDTHRDADLLALVSEMRAELSQLRREVSELQCEAGYWKSRHADAVERNQKLRQELDQARAEIRQLKADQFGRKSEKQSSADRSNHLDDPQDPNSANKKKRGQQPNRPGPARRDYSHLPVHEQLVDIPPEARVCGRCGKPLEDRGETEDSEQVEIELSVYRRRIRRRRYRKTCQCPGPRTLTAPKPPKLIPKGRYGTSLWVHLLLEKFHTGRPIQRTIEQLRLYGLRVPSEALSLRWTDINWSGRRLTVASPKTKKQGKPYRTLPLFPELEEALSEAMAVAPPGAEFCITRYRSQDVNLRTQLLKIIRRAGVQPWAKPWQNLRSTRATELRRLNPSHCVAAWLGHSEDVCAKHYLQTTDEDFDRALAGADAGAEGKCNPSISGNRAEAIPEDNA